MHRKTTLGAHIGFKVREARLLCGMSRQDLAEHLQLSVSQVQKYEGGATRVSAALLFEIGQLTGRDVSFFFDGWNEEKASGAGVLSPIPVVSKKNT